MIVASMHFVPQQCHDVDVGGCDGGTFHLQNGNLQSHPECRQVTEMFFFAVDSFPRTNRCLNGSLKCGYVIAIGREP